MEEVDVLSNDTHATVQGPLTALSNVQVDIMTALVSFDRIFEVLDLEPMIKDSPGAQDIPRGQATIEFDHVGFSYPKPEEVSRWPNDHHIMVVLDPLRIDQGHKRGFVESSDTGEIDGLGKQQQKSPLRRSSSYQ